MKRYLLFASILLAAFTLASSLYFYRVFSEASRKQQAETPIRVIAQTGPEKGALKTDYLAELIQGASWGDMKHDLLQSPAIKEAEVKLLSPGTLSIDYTVRKPYVWLSDYENIALDHEGFPLPFAPLYTPKNMPFIVLGKPEIKWGRPIACKKIKLAFELLDFLQKDIDFFSIKTVDVSQIDNPSLGRAEVVIVLKNENGRHYLRFNPRSLREQWKRYLLLEFEEGDQVIDLRLEKLAYIKEIKDE